MIYAYRVWAYGCFYQITSRMGSTALVQVSPGRIIPPLYRSVIPSLASTDYLVATVCGRPVPVALPNRHGWGRRGTDCMYELFPSPVSDDDPPPTRTGASRFVFVWPVIHTSDTPAA